MTQGAASSLSFAVWGKPIAHTLSPAIHQAAFRAMGLAHAYAAWEVAQPAVGEACARARTQLHGVNVTRPLKQAVIPCLDGLTDEARRLGAVNVLFFRHGTLLGTNTDGDGFLDALGDDPRGMRVLLLGSGGAARAVGQALAGARARVTVAARGPAGIDWSLPPSEVLPWETRERAGGPYDGVVNATPLGQAPDPTESPFEAFERIVPGGFAMDLVYRPRLTRFLVAAAQAGVRPIDGVSMLAYQAARSWRHWFGADGPADVMRQAAVEVLDAEAGRRLGQER